MILSCSCLVLAKMPALKTQKTTKAGWVALF
jgi:hypothetical protein